MALAPDTVLQNRYRIVRLLGQGGMGSVYLTIDQRFDGEVAIKESHFTDETVRKQFEREARLLNKLRHPAMTRVIDHFTEGDGQFLVMDYVEGEDLWETLRTRGDAFPPDKVLEWADQLLDALCYLHKQDPPIIHRDIKPQNLKLSDSGQIILLDFGLAKGTLGQSTSIMTSRSVFGYTPSYAPLEQIHGVGTDPRSDIYSLGVTLYHLITGIIPTDAPTRFTALEEGRDDPIKPAHEVNPEVTREVSEILKGAMAVSRKERIANADDMREALRNVRGEAENAIPLPPTVIGIALSEQEEHPRPLEPTVLSADEREDSQLTETERLRLKYWTAFREYLNNHNSFLKPKKPQPYYWYPFALGRTNFGLAATMQRKGRKIGVNITLSGPDAKPHFHLLHQDKEEIEHKMGEPLEWRERASGKESHIILNRYGTDPSDKQDWESQFEWLKEKLELFYQVFAPRIKNLNASDYVPNSQGNEKQIPRSTIVSPTIASHDISANTPSIESKTSIPSSALEAPLVQSEPKSNRVAWIITILATLVVISITLFSFANRSDNTTQNSNNRNATISSPNVPATVSNANSGDIEIYSSASVEEFLDEGKYAEARDSGRYAEAEIEAREAIKRNPNAAAYHLALADAFFSQEKDYEQAEAEIRTAIRLDPQNGRWRHSLGGFLLYQGKLEEGNKELAEAERLLNAARAKEPDNAKLYWRLAKVLTSQGKGGTPEALQYAREAVRLDPNDAEAHSTLSSVLNLAGGAGEEAEREKQEAIRLKPNRPEYHLELAIILMERDKLADAEVVAREAVRLAPRLSVYHSLLGTVLQREGKIAEAKAELQEALRLNPEDNKAKITLETVERQSKK